jgi:hypothetical protein
VIAGALLAGLGGWHHWLGIVMLFAGTVLALVTGLDALRGKGRKR